jgi:predicted lactoylglutathione lyase
VSFGPPGAPALYLYRAKGSARSTAHIALTAQGKAQVKAFHERGLSAGGKDNGAPGIRADYAPDYYAAFLIDPEGNNLEAVCFSLD